MPNRDPVTRLNTALQGRYRVEGQLGEGGMATVYLADDLRHGRKVALKVLKPELAAAIGADRFLAEIKTTANLQHPHILPLFDSGAVDSHLFYVMPFVEGESLRERLDRENQLPVDEATQIAKDVAEALDYAHRRGVIHRDIKPANILLQDGTPVVSDFGIALALGEAGAGRLTETGLSLGTPHYMSPEQATGDLSVGAATDIYGLGCVLYEMLVGEPPYTGSTPQAVLGKIVTGEAPSASAQRKSVPPNVDEAIRRALEKLPADRFGSAREFARALEDPAFRHSQGSTVMATARRRSQWTPLAGALSAAALVFAAGFAWLLFHPTTPQPVSRVSLSTNGWNGMNEALGRYTALAPDGSSMILHVGDRLALKMRGSTEITPIPGTEGGRDVVYSPDAQWILYSVGSELFKRPVVGGSPVRLARDAPPTAGVVALSWLDDGTLLYEQYVPDETGSTRRLVQIPEGGGEPELVFGIDEEVGIVWVRGLPGGRGALVVACPGTTCTGSRTQLHVLDLERRTSEVVGEQVLRAWYASSGHLVYVRNDGAVLAQPFDLGSLRVTGAAVPIFDRVRVTKETSSDYADMLLGADGTLLYAEALPGADEALQQLVVVDLRGNEQTLPLPPRPITWTGWSPDGETVVYDSQGQIYTYNVRLGTTPRQVTFEGMNRMGVFSPDGTRLAFASVRAGTDSDEIFVKTLGDDSPPRMVIKGAGAQLPTQWLADTLLLFEQYSVPTTVDLWTGNPSSPDASEGAPYLAAEASLYDAVVSPDGRLAAYRSDEGGRAEIYIRSFPRAGARTVVSQGGGEFPFWSPDGNTLYYGKGIANGGVAFMAARLRHQPAPAVLRIDSLFTIGPIQRPFSGSPLHPSGDRWILARTVEAPASGGAARSPGVILVQNFFDELKRVVPR